MHLIQTKTEIDQALVKQQGFKCEFKNFTENSRPSYKLAKNTNIKA